MSIHRLPSPDDVRIALLSRPCYLSASGKAKKEAGVGVDFAGDCLVFGATGAVLPAEPPSKTFQVLSSSGQTLHLRRWWLSDVPEPLLDLKPAESNLGASLQKANLFERKPVLLMIHGLGSRSAWQAPLVQELMKTHPNLVYYAIDLPQISINPTGRGHFDHPDELLTPVRETIDWLGRRHGGPVYGVGISLGGLLLTRVAANPPEALKGITLVSPALQANRDVFKRFARSMVGSLAGTKEQPESGQSAVRKTKPPEPESFVRLLSPLQQKLLRESEAAQDRASDLTVSSYLKVLKMMALARHADVRRIDIPVRVFMTDTEADLEPQGALDAVRRLRSRDKQVTIYPGARHNLVFDPHLETMAADISEWLDGIAGKAD